MSYQRMLMIAATKKPQLPYPEDLVLLFVPKWQNGGSTLVDFSGRGHDFTLRNHQWSDEALQFPNVSGRGYWLGTDTHFYNYTLLADRDLRPSPSSVRYGFLCSYRSNAADISFEVRNKSLGYWADVIKSNAGAVQAVNIAANGWSWMKTESYNGQSIVSGAGTRVEYGYSFSGLGLEPYWQTIRCVIMWRRQLTEAEIAKAKKFIEETDTPIFFNS